MKNILGAFCALAVLCMVSLMGVTKADAAGFGLYEWSNRANGMGGALIALADEPSAIAYNPAGMTQLEGTQTQVGMTLIAPSASLEIGGETYDTAHKVYTPPHMYLTHQLNEDFWVGFGAYTRFGVGTNYDNDWAGRYNVYKASLESYSLSPAVAYKINDDWSVGAALDCMYLSFDLRQYTSPLAPTGDSDFHMDNTGWAWGWNVSTRYEITDKAAVGLMYRAPQRLVGSGESKLIDSGLTEDLTMRATLPGSVSMGFAYKFTDTFRVEVDAIYTNWSDYKKIEYRFGDATALQAFGSLSSDIDSDKYWNDVWRYQLGAEWDVADHHTIRAGIVLDESPIQKGYEDYMLPSNDRVMYSAGYSYSDSAWSVDLSLMYLDMLGRHIDANLAKGVYDTEISNSHAWLGGVSFSYAF